jgi:hypothetical protein
MIHELLNLVNAVPLPDQTPSRKWLKRHRLLLLLIWSPPLIVLLYLAVRQALES